jgi:hypothetical protein
MKTVMTLTWYRHNRQTSGESASLPQYLGCNTVFDMRLRVTFLLSIIRPIIIYFHSSQCRLIPYLHQRPIFFKADSSIVTILELIRGVQCSIEVIRSCGEEMWRVDAYQIPYYVTRTSEGPFENWRVIVKHRVEARVPSSYFWRLFLTFRTRSNNRIM